MQRVSTIEFRVEAGDTLLKISQGEVLNIYSAKGTDYFLVPLAWVSAVKRELQSVAVDLTYNQPLFVQDKVNRYGVVKVVSRRAFKGVRLAAAACSRQFMQEFFGDRMDAIPHLQDGLTLVGGNRFAPIGAINAAKGRVRRLTIGEFTSGFSQVSEDVQSGWIINIYSPRGIDLFLAPKELISQPVKQSTGTSILDSSLRHVQDVASRHGAVRVQNRREKPAAELFVACSRHFVESHFRTRPTAIDEGIRLVG